MPKISKSLLITNRDENVISSWGIEKGYIKSLRGILCQPAHRKRKTSHAIIKIIKHAAGQWQISFAGMQHIS
jgi:hypothetical protein